MRKLLLIAVTLLFSVCALGSTNRPSLVRVRSRHHVHHHKAHNAGKHHAHHRNRHGV